MCWKPQPLSPEHVSRSDRRYYLSLNHHSRSSPFVLHHRRTTPVWCAHTWQYLWASDQQLFTEVQILSLPCPRATPHTEQQAKWGRASGSSKRQERFCTRSNKHPFIGFLPQKHRSPELNIQQGQKHMHRQSSPRMTGYYIPSQLSPHFLLIPKAF